MTTTKAGQADSERLPTGVDGLDAILHGGVYRGGIYIVQGIPGSGKTILGNQICFASAARGARALYVTLLAETHSRMISHMRRLSFFDEAALPDRITYIGAFRQLQENGLRGLLDLIRQEVRGTEAEVVVLDGLATVGESASSNLELKKFVHELQTQAVFTNCTMFMLTSGIQFPQPLSPEYTMVDGLVEMKTRMFARYAVREMQVHKLRGSDYISGEHSFRIDDAGIHVFPRIEALLSRPTYPDTADGKLVTLGVDTLDSIIGGGIDRHSVTVITGPAGSGKTTLGLHFLSASTEDEPGLMLGFHENPAAVRLKAQRLGLPLEEFFSNGRFAMIWQPATEALVDEVCIHLLQTVKERRVKRLFFDGVGGFARLFPDRNRLEACLAALCNELRGVGVTTLITAETDLGGGAPAQPLGGLGLTGLSPVAENIIALRIAATRSEMHRLLAVMKARHAQIDLRMRRFSIGNSGIVVDNDFGAAEQILGDLFGPGVRSAQAPKDAPRGD
ncbi:MAG: circadian clock protein KaiC [Variibacter sp.]|nr:circadian clock protein KaiC [Variibacter sp.]